MSHFELLCRRSAAAREAFTRLPLIEAALRGDVPRTLYLAFLGEAYHHVRHTVPLLLRAAEQCGSADGRYRAGLLDYVAEERGHEEWILDDIADLGGDAAAVRGGAPRLPCKVMVSHAYYLVDRVSPYALLGMIHVLEGMSVAFAARAAAAIRGALGGRIAGFKYLVSHGAADIGHTRFFAGLVDGIEARHLETVIAAAEDFYALYGGIFRDLDAGCEAPADAG